LRAAVNLESSAIAVGNSAKLPITEQAREVGLTWERMPEPRPRVALEIFTPGGQEQIFYLGPHAPRLTPKEIDLLHRLWLQLSDKIGGQELHHHDIVHFALDELERELQMGQVKDIVDRLESHLNIVKEHRNENTDSRPT